MLKQYYAITGMTCSACSSRVEKSVTHLKGIHSVSVNLLKNSMSVEYDENITSAQEIAETVKKIGYGAVISEPNGKKTEILGTEVDPAILELKEIKQRLIISLLFTLPLFYISMGHMMGLPLPPFFLGVKNALAFGLTQLLLTLPVLSVNRKFFRVGFTSLLSRSPNMDTLIALGSGAAVLFGIYAIYKMAFALGQGDMKTVQHFAMNLYFESSAMILSLITLGKFFEARAKGKTSSALSKLMDLAPKKATKVEEGIERSVPLEEVVVGDILVVKAGESVPVDGIITEGNGFIDESAITGESLPIEKKDGDSTIGATINASGRFLMRATRVGNDTTLSQIVKLVDEATSSKAPIARLADKVSGIFVPIVILIAVISTTVWLLLGYPLEFSLSIGIAVLVISCPCALGLATPTAIMVGTGRGAINGILFKSAEAIERAREITTVILDKTGTVTKGKPVVTDIISAKTTDEDTLLSIAASLEKMSEHPLGKAIVSEAESRSLPLSKVNTFSQIAGQGIVGTIDGMKCLAGNATMIKEHNIENSELFTRGNNLAEKGKTPLYFAQGNKILGIIAVADVIKPTSQQAVAELLAMGIKVIMLTGDNAKTAAAIQHEAGIPEVIADVLPQDKEREVHALQQRGEKVAMIGDGINDAPALARADVGIAIGAGTDIAIESADIVLMKSDLLDATAAIQLSHAVIKNIKQNLFWAFFYNAVGIPVAAGVFYYAFHWTLSPMLAAGAMSLSSVSVVLNALRLRFFMPKHLKQRDALNTDSNLSTNHTQQNQRSFTMIKTIAIEGMSCGHCSATVEKALSALHGVSSVNVDLAAKTATIEAEGVDDDSITKAVTDAGFTVSSIK